MVVVWKDAEELNQKKFLECNGLALSVALGVRQFTSGGPVPGLHQCLGKWAVRSCSVAEKKQMDPLLPVSSDFPTFPVC